MIRALILWLALAGAACAEQIVMGLSESRVAITATFDGSDILVFGAVKRDSPPPDTGPLEVIIAVSGPQTPVTVRRKDRRFGLWVNVDEVAVDSAPSFYAVATTGPLADVLTEVEDLRHHITIPRAIRSVGNTVIDSGAFTDALVRIRAGEGLFRVMEGAVLLTEETLFRVQIGLPANLIEGNYDTRIYLTRNGQVVDTFETLIAVRKVGIERWLYNLSRDAPLAYAALALALAIVAGWSASALFQVLRR